MSNAQDLVCVAECGRAGGLRGGIGVLGVLLLLVLGTAHASSSRIPLVQLPKTTVRAGAEWRLAHEIPGGRSARVDLGQYAGQTVLRLGVLNQGNATVTATLWAGDAIVTEVWFPRSAGWQDKRVDVGKDVPAGTPMSVVVASMGRCWLSPCELVPQRSNAPNVLLFIMDTVRQDHLGCYGYNRPTSPNIDRFAEDAVLFTEMVPQSSWTRPSVASFLTSTYPPEHGAVNEMRGIQAGVPRLATAMAAAGYETQAVISNIITLPLWGFGEGFSRCVDADSVHMLTMDRRVTMDAAWEAIESCSGRPWFVAVHSMGAHNPYIAPKSFRRKFRSEGTPRSLVSLKRLLDSTEDCTPEYYLLFGVKRNEHASRRRKLADVLETVKPAAIDAYDAAIAYNDTVFQVLIDKLKSTGIYDNTLIVLVSDHGEEFWDHGGMFHGGHLGEELLRVPCLVKYPGSKYAGQKVDAIVEGVDIAPTILDIAGVPPENRFRGHSFAGYPASSSGIPQHIAFSARSIGEGYDPVGICAAKTKQYKLVSSPYRNYENWFDLVADPKEQSPLKNPPAIAPALYDCARRNSLTGVAGFQLLIRANLENVQEFTGTVRCSDIKRFSFGQTDGIGNATQSAGDTVTFTAKMKATSEDPVAMVRDPASGEPEGAKDPWQDVYLTIEGDINSPVSIKVEVNGAVPAKEEVALGKGRKNVTLDGQEFSIADLLGDESTFAEIPKRFGIFAWYIPTIPPVEIESLDAPQREALEAAGYLGTDR